jgi:Hemerythrin HHE cation binding domain
MAPPATDPRGIITMADTAELPLADTTEMAAVHRVFRKALAQAPQLVGPAAGDAERAELVGSYYENVLRLLHVHHEGEDALLTPLLLERAAADERAEASRIAAQHADVLTDLEAAERRIAEFRAQPTVDNAATLAGSLATLNASLTAHLDEEENVAMPIAARYINVVEWGQLPAHGIQHFDGDKLWLVLGLLRKEMSDAQRANMDAHMPPPLFQYWAETGQGLYTDYVSALGI